MSVNLFLFLSLFFAFFILFFAYKDLLYGILKSRRESIISATVSLKKDLKFVELDREKSYNEYLIDKNKTKDWQEEAESAYLSCYNQQHLAYQSFIGDEKNKISFMKKNKEKEAKILVLKSIIRSLCKNAGSKNINLNIDFVKLIEEINF